MPLALIKLLQGANVAGLFGPGNTREVLEGVDRVPLASFPAEAATHLVFSFAAWGLGIFLLGLLAVVALLRYRAMIPLVYLLLLIEQLGRKLQSMVHLGRPFVSLDPSPANVINWVFLVVIVLGFLASLIGRRPGRSDESRDRGEGPHIGSPLGLLHEARECRSEVTELAPST